jgi:hypothetical protein
MGVKHPELRLPDMAALRTHAVVIGSTGSGKQCLLLAALGLHFGDGYGKSYFQSFTPDVLAAFLAKFEAAPRPTSEINERPR